MTVHSTALRFLAIVFRMMTPKMRDKSFVLAIFAAAALTPVTGSARINHICVIGAHGVGKSTLVKALKDAAPWRNFQVADEVARQASASRAKPLFGMLQQNSSTVSRLPCPVVRRVCLPRTCVYGSRPASAHPLGAIRSNVSACRL